jgi:hypothetical protein
MHMQMCIEENTSLLSKTGFASRRFGQAERPGGLSLAA